MRASLIVREEAGPEQRAPDSDPLVAGAARHMDAGKPKLAGRAAVQDRVLRHACGPGNQKKAGKSKCTCGPREGMRKVGVAWTVKGHLEFIVWQV